MILSDGAGIINRPNLQNEIQQWYGLLKQINGFTLGLSKIIYNEVYFIDFQDYRRNSEVPNLKIKKGVNFSFFEFFRC